MRRWILIALVALGTAGLIGLGVWQLERRVWKLALIERVEQRVHAEPVAPPGPARWGDLSRENSEYLRVSATGHFQDGAPTLVRAVTALGGGYWVMAPFQTEEGFVVLVNRGFVPPEWRDEARGAASTAADASATTAAPASSAPSANPPAAQAKTSLTGLLRISEPNGAFLRTNAPANNQWYSRDVAAISHAKNLANAAPYFIDADADAHAGGESGGPPVGGLTVIAFRNSHLLYAFTWFTLALMTAALGVRMARHR